ncbi:DUF58 domain-containing protein, partial [Mesorhizobium sp. VK3C]|nr:DUF58 domain-containing protein [Mesorhizobium sp. VK3C]
TGDKLTAGRAETLKDEYRLLYAARRQELAGWCQRLGWSFTVNHTDRLASDALVRVHMAMTADSSRPGLTAGGSHAGLTAGGSHAGLTADGSHTGKAVV